MSMNERQEYITESSAGLREQAAATAMAATVYHELLHGDNISIRKAAGWMLKSGGAYAPAQLHDNELIHQEQKALFQETKDQVSKAKAVESWAASIFDHRESPDVKALKNLRRFDGINLDQVEDRPEIMLSLEDIITEDKLTVEALRDKADKIKEAIRQRNLEGVDLYDAAKQIRSSERPVTALKLASRQKAIIWEKIERLEDALALKNDVIQTFRTGQASERLRDWIRATKPDAYGETRPKNPLDDLIIEELEIGVRAYNILKKGGIFTLGELVNRSAEELLALPYCGKKSVDEIEQVLEARGLSLRQDTSSGNDQP